MISESAAQTPGLVSIPVELERIQFRSMVGACSKLTVLVRRIVTISTV